MKERLSRSSLLHAILHEEARELYGVDLDEKSLWRMQHRLGFANLYQGDVEHLEQLDLHRTFDIVVAGDLLEHLSCPRALLDGSKRFLRPGGRFVVSTNNAFGLHFQIRRWRGTYTEHPEHVCFFSPETLVHLLERHGYEVQEVHGSYTEPPHERKQRILFAIGSPLFKAIPVLAGTLLAVATLPQHG